jgi:hypothetical protein
MIEKPMLAQLYRFEKRHERLLPVGGFVTRMVAFAGLGLILEAAVVLMGAIGFHYSEQLNWLDSLLNATMVVTGNGPTFQPESVGGTLFQIGFSLCGVLSFLLVLSVIVTPVLHRLLHYFNVDVNEEAGKSQGSERVRSKAANKSIESDT